MDRMGRIRISDFKFEISNPVVVFLSSILCILSIPVNYSSRLTRRGLRRARVGVRRAAPPRPRRELRRSVALPGRSRRERVRALRRRGDAAGRWPRRRASAALTARRARAAARLAARRLAERADVGDELKDLLLAQLSAEGRHDRLEADRELRLRVED